MLGGGCEPCSKKRTLFAYSLHHIGERERLQRASYELSQQRMIRRARLRSKERISRYTRSHDYGNKISATSSLVGSLFANVA
jgi:VIT1/CCC1 family predicted Fe2+/Mn2+ transporter